MTNYIFNQNINFFIARQLENGNRRTETGEQRTNLHSYYKSLFVLFREFRGPQPKLTIILTKETKVPNFYSFIWKQFSRSARFKTGLVGRIFIGFAFMFFLVEAGALSYFFIDIIEKEAPQKSPIDLLDNGLFYALLLFLVLRLLFQRQSSMSVRPYLHLPIKRNALVRFILFDSALTFFNLITLVLVLPFFFRAVVPLAGGLPALSWLLSFLLLMTFTSYLATWFRFQISNNLTVVFSIILLVIVLGLLEYYHIISLAGLSQTFFTASFHSPWPLLFAALLSAAIVAVNVLYLKRHLYLNVGPGKVRTKSKKQARQIKNPQLYKELLKLEFRLLKRNKRTRMTLFFLLYFPLYFVLMINTFSNHSDILVLFQIIVIGIFVLQIGGGLFSFESVLFDKLLTIKLSMKQYYQYKWILYSASCIAFFLLLLPFCFIFPQVIRISNLTAALIFNLGVSIGCTLLFSLFDPKYFDLDGNVSFNFQGSSFKSFLWTLPFLVFFIILAFVFDLSVNVLYVYILGGLGVVFLVCMPFIIKFTNNQFLKRKYFIAGRLREGRS
jgi:hypothetical protein